MCMVAVNVEVQFSFPPTYPDIPPEMEVVSSSGLSPDHVEEIETFLQEQVCHSKLLCYAITISILSGTMRVATNVCSVALSVRRSLFSN